MNALLFLGLLYLCRGLPASSGSSGRTPSTPACASHEISVPAQLSKSVLSNADEGGHAWYTVSRALSGQELVRGRFEGPWATFSTALCFPSHADSYWIEVHADHKKAAPANLVVCGAQISSSQKLFISVDSVHGCVANSITSNSIAEEPSTSPKMGYRNMREKVRDQAFIGAMENTLEPTFEPIQVTVTDPTAEPTVSPTCEPTVLPSLLPSHAPTHFTTLVDRRTFRPSSRPTGNPSLRPSSHPLARPSMQPDVEPSPSGRPSVQPTGSPTDEPSSWPSFGPSLSPSSDPSSVPTFITGDNFVNVENQTTQYLAGQKFELSHYNSLNCRGTYLKPLSDWSNFLDQLQTVSSAEYPTSAVVFASKHPCWSTASGSNLAEYNSSLVTSYSCSGRPSVEAIWTALLGGTEARIQCNGNVWAAKKCPGDVPRLCVGCDNPCMLTRSDNIGSAVMTTTRVPLNTTGTLELVTSGVGFQMSPKLALWIGWKQSCTVDPPSQSVQLSYTLNGPGILTCGLYNRNLRNPLLPLSQVFAGADVLSGVLSLPLDSSLTVDNLVVLCSSDVGIRNPNIIAVSPTSYDKMNACNVTVDLKTLRSVSVSLSASFTRLPLGTVSPPISISLSNAPSTPVVIAAKVYLVQGGDCSTSSMAATVGQWLGSNGTLVELNNVVIAPLVVTFTRFSALTANVYVQAKIPGCYVVKVSPASASGVNTTITNSNSAIGILVPDSLSSATVGVKSAAFVSNGYQLIVSFSGSTDQGRSRGLDQSISWPCTALFEFPSADTSTCFFSSSSQVTIGLNSQMDDDYFPVAGTNITVFGNVVKLACTASIFLPCKDYPFMSQSIVAVSTDIDVEVSITLVAPRIVHVNSSLVIDTSLVLGSGGRSWSSISWSVIAPSDVTTSNLQELMNSPAMKWFDCPPETLGCNKIPESYLIDEGFYVFTLNLVNFLGVGSSGFVAVDARKFSIPQIAILRQSYSTDFVNNTIVLQTKFSSDHTSLDISTKFEFAWTVYCNNQLVILPSVPLDGSTLVLPKYVLQPQMSYRFYVQALLVSTSDSVWNANLGQSDAFVDIDTLSGDCVAIINGADAKSFYISQNMTLDASSSYSTATGSSMDLLFSWSCIQVSPLNASGCDNFYNFLRTVAPSRSYQPPSFVVPTRVLSFPAQYILTVTVRSVDPSVQPSTAIKIVYTQSSVVGVSYPGIRMQKVSLLWDTESPIELSALINYDQPYRADWSVIVNSVSLNIESRVINGQGKALYPLGMRLSDLPLANSYTFQLAARPLGMAHSEENSTSTFANVVVAVNPKPMFGVLTISPSNGCELDLFTLYAPGWIDDDLPLVYSFYQRALIISDTSVSNYVITYLARGGSRNQSVTLISTHVTDSLGATAKASLFVTILGKPIDDVLVSIESQINMYDSYGQFGDILQAADLLLRSQSLLQCANTSSLALLPANYSDCEQLFTMAMKIAPRITSLPQYIQEVDIVYVYSRLAQFLFCGYGLASPQMLQSVLLTVVNLLDGITSLLESVPSPSYSALFLTFTKEHITNLQLIVFAANSKVLGFDTSNSSFNATETVAGPPAFKSLDEFFSCIENHLLRILRVFMFSALVGDDLRLSNDAFKVHILRYYSQGYLAANANYTARVSSIVSFNQSAGDSSKISVGTSRLLVFVSNLRPSYYCSRSTLDASSCRVSSEKIFVDMQLDAVTSISSEASSAVTIVNPALLSNDSTIGNDSEFNSKAPLQVNASCSGRTVYKLLVNCSSADTNGAAYTFPPLQCQQGIAKRYQFVCPVYITSRQCVVNDVVNPACKVINTASMGTTCVCAVSALNSSSYSAPGWITNQYTLLSNRYHTQQSLVEHSGPQIVLLSSHEGNKHVGSPTHAPTILPDPIGDSLDLHASNSLNLTALIALVSIVVLFGSVGAYFLHNYIKNNRNEEVAYGELSTPSLSDIVLVTGVSSSGDNLAHSQSSETGDLEMGPQRSRPIAVASALEVRPVVRVESRATTSVGMLTLLNDAVALPPSQRYGQDRNYRLAANSASIPIPIVEALPESATAAATAERRPRRKAF